MKYRKKAYEFLPISIILSKLEKTIRSFLRFNISYCTVHLPTSTYSNRPHIKQNINRTKKRNTTTYLQKNLNLKMPPLSLFDITTGLEYATIDDVAIANSINNASLKKRTLNDIVLTTSDTDKQRRRRRKVVSFQSTAQVHMIHGMDDYTEEEKAAVWFTIYERQEMKKERKDTVKIMERLNYYVDDEQHYFRGLEFKTREGFRRKQWNIMELAMVVFDEQMTDARIDPIKAISKAYMINSIGSRVAATERAHHDRRAIEVLLSLSSPSSSSSSSVSTTATAATTATSHVCGEKRIHRRLSPSAA